MNQTRYKIRYNNARLTVTEQHEITSSDKANGRVKGATLETQELLHVCASQMTVFRSKCTYDILKQDGDDEEKRDETQYRS
jgi:hypothetical protein